MESPIKDAIAAAKTQERFLSNAELLQQGNIRIKKTIASMEAAQILSEKAQTLIEGATRAAIAKFPDLNSIPEIQEKSAGDIAYYLRLIQYCLMAGDASPIDESAIASPSTLPASAAIAVLKYIKAHHGLTEIAAREADTYIDCAIKAIAKIADKEDKPHQTSDVAGGESGEILTLEEIYKRYPDEWLLIVSPELDENLNVIRGKVFAHSPDRDEIYNQLSSTKDMDTAIEYTGEVSENLAFIL